jgi:hypothetical protein
VLNLDRYPAGKWIAFIPSAALAFLPNGFDDVTAYGTVEIKTRWQFTGLPKRDDTAAVMFELTTL